MKFCQQTLAVLTEAVTTLAHSEGTLSDRLRCAGRGLADVQPANLDAEQWGDLVRVRGIVRHMSSAGQSQQAADILVNLLVSYAASAANTYRQPAAMLFNSGRRTSYT